MSVINLFFLGSIPEEQPAAESDPPPSFRFIYPRLEGFAPKTLPSPIPLSNVQTRGVDLSALGVSFSPLVAEVGRDEAGNKRVELPVHVEVPEWLEPYPDIREMYVASWEHILSIRSEYGVGDPQVLREILQGDAEKLLAETAERVLLQEEAKASFEAWDISEYKRLTAVSMARGGSGTRERISREAGETTAVNASGGEETVVETDREGKKNGRCPRKSVYVPHLDLCFEESEHTKSGSQILEVGVDLAQAAAICAKMRNGGLVWRLPTKEEWYLAASNNGEFEYSTPDGTLAGSHVAGVHFRAAFARPPCAARGHYIQYNGEEICDLSGNVAEWTSDSCVVGGWYLYQDPRCVKASSSLRVESDVRDRFVGFRCVAKPKKTE